MKIHPVTSRVDRLALNLKITSHFGLSPNKHKLPNDLEGMLHCSLPFENGKETWSILEIVRSTDRMVGQRKVKGVPRIFVHCSCGKLVPTGKITQHTLDEKFGNIEQIK